MRNKTHLARVTDTHSGGGCKLDTVEKIYITILDAPDEKAAIEAVRDYMETVLNRDPYHETCSTCGSDYSIDVEEYNDTPFMTLTGYDRNCGVDDRGKFAEAANIHSTVSFCWGAGDHNINDIEYFQRNMRQNRYMMPLEFMHYIKKKKSAIFATWKYTKLVRNKYSWDDDDDNIF